MKGRTVSSALAALLLVMVSACGAWALSPLQLKERGTLDSKVFHAEQIVTVGDKVYGLANIDDQTNYDAAKFIEFDKDLNVLRSIDIAADGKKAMNAKIWSIIMESSTSLVTAARSLCSMATSGPSR